jgi:hypothetical protein
LKKGKRQRRGRNAVEVTSEGERGGGGRQFDVDLMFACCSILARGALMPYPSQRCRVENCGFTNVD